MVGCLSNGRLRQQWQTNFIGVECLGNGGCPSPTELGHPGFSYACHETVNPEHFQLLFVFVGVGPAKLDHLAPYLRALFF